MTQSTGRTAAPPALLLLALLCAGGCRRLPAALDRGYQRGASPLQITSIGHATFLLMAFLPADGLTIRWGRKLAMDPEDAAQAVEILHLKVVVPILDHDFSASLAGLVLKRTGRVEDCKALVRGGTLTCKSLCYSQDSPGDQPREQMVYGGQCDA